MWINLLFVGTGNGYSSCAVLTWPWSSQEDIATCARLGDFTEHSWGKGNMNMGNYFSGKIMNIVFLKIPTISVFVWLWDPLITTLKAQCTWILLGIILLTSGCSRVKEGGN